MSTTRGLKRREFVDLLENEGLKYITFKEQGLGFTVQCEDEEEVTAAWREAIAAGSLNEGPRLDPALMFEDVFKEVPQHLIRQRQELGV